MFCHNRTSGTRTFFCGDLVSLVFSESWALLGGDKGSSFLCKFVLFCHYRNVSTCEVTSSQATSSPQRSKRVKENTPPRCAMVHNSPACSTSVTCGWGDVASSTTRERQRQTIVIPDTPSPTVSVITISSDTDEEEEQKHAPTR